MGGFKALVPELPLDTFFTEVIGAEAPVSYRRGSEERFWKEILLAANWETQQD